MLEFFKKAGLNVKENEPLAAYTTFKVGGKAKYFLVTENNEEISKALQIAKANKIPFYILGGGSNSLISDKGFNGLVIKIKNAKIKMKNYSSPPKADAPRAQKFKIFEAEAGVLLSALVIQAVRNGLSGLEWAIGIPGTIGGAVRGNAGAYGHSTSESVQEVIALNQELQVTNYELQDLCFAYRSSVFKKDPTLIILKVILHLKQDTPEAVSERMKEIIIQRTNKIPSFPCAGCFFQNIKIKSPADLSEKLAQELPKRFLDVLTVPAAWLIEECGLKGKQIGGARISDEHSNIIINTGEATAEDIITLSSLIKQQVRDKYGIQLKEEVELVGF